MTPQHAGDSLHRLNLRAHRACAPLIEEPPCPIGRGVAPKELEVLLEQVAPDRPQIVSQQLGQADLLLLAQVLRASEQQPAVWVSTGSSPWAFSVLTSWAHTPSMARLQRAMMCLQLFIKIKFCLKSTNYKTVDM
jgi:hypothetical protein